MKPFLKHVVVAILTFEAKLLLRRTKPKIIAITGNVGKTSTKDAIYAVLRTTVKARKSEKSFNSEIGVPLSILGLDNAWSSPIGWLKNSIDGLLIALFERQYADVIVLEMGVDRPGDMQRLTKWIHPDVVVLTRLPDLPVHVEYFDSPDAVIAEKMQLVDALKDDGVLIYNQDDQKICELVAGVRQKSFGYSRYSQSHTTASGDVVLYENETPVGITFSLTQEGESREMILRDTLGTHHVYAMAAAAAVGSLFGVSLDAVASACADFTPPPGRMRIIAGIKDTTIIDDTYNSSPVAAERALSTLKELKVTGRKIAVMGDMLELGSYSVEAHNEVGVQVAECADVLVTVGVRARGIAQSALGNGMNEKYILQYDDAVRAGRELQPIIAAGDVLLIKASQSIRLERVVEDLMAHPEEAEQLLVRQSAVWKSIA